jgi:hypothetical protein
MENLVSNGPYPVTIDHECLFAPLLTDGPEKTAPGFVRSFLLLGFSQLQTPGKKFHSGLFGKSYRLSKTSIRNFNKPNMKVVNTYMVRSGKNIPHVNGSKVDPFNYFPEIKNGYLQMAKLIRDNYKTFQSIVKTSTNDLSLHTRFILRETSWYFDLQEKLKSPIYLESGIARSIKLDQLAIKHICKSAIAERAALLRDEINFMESRFIPAFFQPMNEPCYTKNGIAAKHDTVFAKSASAFYEDSLGKFVSSEYPLHQIDLMEKLLRQQMRPNLGKIIENFLLSLPAKVIQKDNLIAIRKITSGLPVPDLFCLEFHLSNDEPRVDLLICIASKDVANFKNYSGLISQNSREDDINGWSRIDYILNQWSNKNSLIPHIIRNIWITFDLEKVGNQLPEPWTYCLFQDRKSAIKLDSIWAQSAINNLWGQQSVHVLEWLENTLDHLPQGISLFGLGVVRRYNSSRSRIILGGFELSAIVPFLKNLDWKGDLSDIAQITACLGHG